ncbi:MAG: amidase, partial [Alphaproteobacteria bacterium]
MPGADVRPADILEVRGVDDLVLAPAWQQCVALRDGRISARALLELYLDRVERFNPALNAIIVFDREGAMACADAADKALAGGRVLGPLHGLPMTVKESFDFKGLPTTWGLPAMADNIASQHASAVQRLIDAGAVIFGKTNVPVLLADWQTFNDVYGTTNNPWDPSRVPGGSSGGAAVALAAGMTGLELGSDIGASIRDPAHYCGVYGHKPTFGIVPIRGQALPGIVSASDISVAGPLARSAQDLALALDVLAAPNEFDAAGWRLDLPPGKQESLADFKVAVMLDDEHCALDGELVDCLQKAVGAAGRAGARISDGARPDIDLAQSHAIYIQLVRGVTTARVPAEQAAAFRSAAALLDPDDDSYKARLTRAAVQEHRDWMAAHEARTKLRHKWAAFFDEYDVLLCPTAASAAFVHNHEGDRENRTILVNGRQESTMDQLFWA